MFKPWMEGHTFSAIFNPSELSASIVSCGKEVCKWIGLPVTNLNFMFLLPFWLSLVFYDQLGREQFVSFLLPIIHYFLYISHQSLLYVFLSYWSVIPSPQEAQV